MGHSKAEKAASRKRILTAAASRIREAGLDGIGVGEIMKSVNLTHGGFYGHFASRDALVAAALEQALADGNAAFMDHNSDGQRVTVKSIVNAYLSPAHRDRPGSGCAIPSLGGEVGRADPEVRAIMARQLLWSFGILEEAFEGDEAEAEQFAVSAWSMMVGAMMVSRVLADDPMADRVLAHARKSILDLAAAHRAKTN